MMKIWKLIIFIIGSINCIDPIDIDLLQAVNMPGVKSTLVTFHTIQYFILAPLDTHFINSVRHGDTMLFQRNNTSCLKIVTTNNGTHSFIYIRIITQSLSDLYFRFYLPIHGPPVLGRMAPALTTVNTLLRLLANSHPSLNPRGFNMFDNSDPIDEDEGEDSDSDGDDDDGDDGDEGGDGGDNGGGGFGGGDGGNSDEGGDDGNGGGGDEILGPAAIGAVDIALGEMNQEGIQGMIGGLQEFVPNIPEQEGNSPNESEGDEVNQGEGEEEDINYEMVQHEGEGLDDSGDNEQDLGMDLSQYAGYFRISTLPINEQMEQDIDQKILEDMEEIDLQIQQELGQGMGQMGEGIDQFGQGIDQFGQGIEQSGDGIDQFGGLAPNLSELLDAFLDNLIQQQLNPETMDPELAGYTQSLGPELAGLMDPVGSDPVGPGTLEQVESSGNVDTPGLMDPIVPNIIEQLESTGTKINEPLEQMSPELVEVEMESEVESEGHYDLYDEDKTDTE
ncbi:uncharacterized protein TA15555 [Theileria annulata]|uniref:Uncharacterized protein n=1 Tax=Theileria annulata TaxID=5874 RepID=Q4UFJ9_THEAN|nr:uncharacterized protein TA15555 [Theileria annulata]CAI74117.1 hypothetical protein, conserved [Theileria annulata]|eukprot:XP_951849.1 hypothetical protein, conserved [Theileria annulata]